MSGDWDDNGIWIGGETQDWSESLDTDTVAQGVGTLVGLLLSVGVCAAFVSILVWFALLMFGVI